MTSRRQLPLVNDQSSNLVRCHRHGYTSISPQACLEKASKHYELCGSCGHSESSMKRLAEAVSGGYVRLAALAREGRLGSVSDPHINNEDRPHEGRPGEKRVNTEIVFINGMLVLSSLYKVTSRGGLDKEYSIEFERSLMNRRDLNSVQVFVYSAGRIQARGEWQRPADYTDPEDKYKIRLKSVSGGEFPV